MTVRRPRSGTEGASGGYCAADRDAGDRCARRRCQRLRAGLARRPARRFRYLGRIGYTIGKSVALALVDDGFAEEGTALSVHIVGVERPARVIAASPYDPEGRAMRQ